LRAYYQEHQQEYQQPEQIRARHILVDTEEQAAAARARIVGGEDFAKVAREVSKDAAEGGGDLGWFGRGRMVPPFEQAAFDATIGEVVGPVKTQFGYHLIQVQEKRAGATSPFEEVRQAVRARFAAERAAQLAEAKAKTIAADVTKAGAKAAEKMKELAAQQPGLERGTTEAFSRQGAIVPLGSAPAVNAAVFGLAGKGAVTEPLRAPRGWVVLRLVDVKAPHQPALAEVRESVRRGAEQEKQRQQAFDRLQTARKAFGPGATLDAVAAQLGVPVQQSEEFGQGATVPPLGYAPELAKAAMTQPVGTLGGPVSAAGSAVLYQVASRQGMDPADFAKQKDGLREQLEQEQVGALISSLINARKQELGVTYDPQLVKQLGGKQGQQAG
jgi:peptidyl-prolyl cis-trans isomerase D